jgi:hypothetical protein
MDLDLHGYSPDQIIGTDVLKAVLQQAWETGETDLRIIHGHGHKRGISPGFVNTNTGYFGLEIRRALRHDKSLRQWIKYTTLDCSHDGSTTVGLKLNPAPTRTGLDPNVLPERAYNR